MNAAEDWLFSSIKICQHEQFPAQSRKKNEVLPMEKNYHGEQLHVY